MENSAYEEIQGRARPGLRGEGPWGGTRGDTEQWKFPHVRLRAGERKLLIAKVVMLATTAMFKHHYYGFAGAKYQQRDRFEGYMLYS